MNKQFAERQAQVLAILEALAKEAARHVMMAIGSLAPNSMTLDGFTQAFDSLDQRMKRLEDEVELVKRRFAARERPMTAGTLG